jgi:hypothetical protein
MYTPGAISPIWSTITVPPVASCLHQWSFAGREGPAGAQAWANIDESGSLINPQFSPYRVAAASTGSEFVLNFHHLLPRLKKNHILIVLIKKADIQVNGNDEFRFLNNRSTNTSTVAAAGLCSNTQPDQETTCISPFNTGTGWCSG